MVEKNKLRISSCKKQKLSYGLGGMSTKAERFRDTFQMPVHRVKDARKLSKKVRQKGLNMSVGGEDGKEDQCERLYIMKEELTGNMVPREIWEGTVREGIHFVETLDMRK